MASPTPEKETSSMSSRVLYDLAGAEDDRRFSPYCWRTRMALAHKGLSAEAIPWRFTEKDVIAFSGQGKVPVLVDGKRTVSDSWAIAVYLEETYSDRPSLFGGPAAMSVTRFINAWADRILIPGIAPLIVTDIFGCLHEKDKAYFRATREKAFGAPLESVSADRDVRARDFRRTLEPIRTVLRHQAFLGGETPSYADYIPFAAFQWARCTSMFELLDPDDPITGWIENLLNAFGGLARNARC
jgi:glutathione S-transferase